MMSGLNDYFMKPTPMKSGLLIYPVKILEYEEFKYLFSEYMLLDITRLNNIMRQQHEIMTEEGKINPNEKYKKIPFDNIYDYRIDTIKKYDSILEKEKINMSNEMYLELKKNNLVKNSLIKIIEIVTLCEVNYVGDMELFSLKKDNKIVDFINKDNFEEFRNIVMRQNIIFQPRIAYNLKSQKYIDTEIKKKFGDNDSSLETIIAMVSMEYGGKDISDFTYYRVIADFRVLCIKLGFISSNMYRANGCKNKDDSDIEVPSLSGELNLLKNPYDDILRASKETDLDRTLMNR